MNQKALALLERLTTRTGAEGDRLTEVLRDPEADNAPNNWFMYVPTSFNGALDIQQTQRVLNPKTKPVPVWTQGREFKFKNGDMIYDTPAAYDIWKEALKQFRFCIQVRQSTDATTWKAIPAPAAPASELNLIGKPNAKTDFTRYPGSISFDVYVPNHEKTQLTLLANVVLTQDAFVRLLITGEGMPPGPS